MGELTGEPLSLLAGSAVGIPIHDRRTGGQNGVDGADIVLRIGALMSGKSQDTDDLVTQSDRDDDSVWTAVRTWPG